MIGSAIVKLAAGAVLASASGAGADNPALVDAASAKLANGRLELTVDTSKPVEARDVHTKLRGHHFFVYLEGAQARPDRMHLGGDDMPITVWPRAAYVKLEIPFPATAHCAGDPTVNRAGGSLHVNIGCAAGAPTTASNASKKEAEATLATKSPVDATNDASEPPVRAPAKQKPVTKTPAAERRLTANPVEDSPAPAPAPSASPSSSSSSSSSSSLTPSASSSSSHTSAVAGLLLLLAAAGIAVAWKRRRVRLDKQIRIIETASLGPKRSLILAEVGGKTLVLGASEAGITLLSTNLSGEGEPPAEELAPLLQLNDEIDALDREAREGDQGGRLSRLFARDAAEEGGSETDPFAGALAEEDQQLRQRLGAGNVSAIRRYTAASKGV